MPRWKDLSETERQAVTARLEARDRLYAQYAPARPPRTDLDKALDFWRARDLYRVQNFFLGLWLFVMGALLLPFMLLILW
jgi:hypothetical protein